VARRQSFEAAVTISVLETPSTTKDKLILLFFVFINGIVVFAANAFFVYGSLTADTTTILYLQAFLGLCKALWREYYVKNICNMHRSITGNQSMKIRHETSFLAVILIINNALIPLFAEAAVDSDCIYNMFIAPDPITVSYTYLKCTDLIFTPSDECGTMMSVTNSISFIPPFIYRYQCSSAVIKNYSSVYVYMYLITTFDATVMSALKQLRSNFSKGGVLFTLLNWCTNDIDQDPPTFHSNNFVADVICSIAILMTLGAAFPPLAVIICVSIVVNSAYTLRQLHIILPNVAQEPPQVDVGFILLLIPASAVFVGFFLYDILGVRNNIWSSLWASITILCVSLALWFVGFVCYAPFKRSVKQSKGKKVYAIDDENVMGGISIDSPLPATVLPVDEKQDDDENVVLSDHIARDEKAGWFPIPILWRASRSPSKGAVLPVITRQTSGIEVVL